jgi:hypothetical protein
MQRRARWSCVVTTVYESHPTAATLADSSFNPAQRAGDNINADTFILYLVFVSRGPLMKSRGGVCDDMLAVKWAVLCNRDMSPT